MAKTPAKRLKPTPKNKISKGARRVAIVKGLVGQKRPAEIARAIGVSRKTVYEELRAPETQQLIREWMRDYHAEVRALIPKAIATVAEGLAPSRKFHGVEVPADMAVRIRAVRALGIVMGWAQGKVDENGETPAVRKFTGTMEELLLVYRELANSEAESS